MSTENITRSNPTYLLDTSALIALIEREPGAEWVQELLANETVLLPCTALLETYYITLQEQPCRARGRGYAGGFAVQEMKSGAKQARVIPAPFCCSSEAHFI